MNTEIPETIKAGLLGLDMQIPELLAQRKFVSAAAYAYLSAHKLPKTVAFTILMLQQKF